ncbi:hypothetical protein DITRI_Ditri12bG0190000 [Diplodiscus trichospermus]
MESQSSNSLRKPIRRRSHTRKIAQGCVINMAEARREIAHCLHLHRSSSSSLSTSTKTASYVAQEREPWMVGNSNNSSSSSSTKKHTSLATSYCCYSLMEAMPMPLPEPVWSTTAPSVPAALPGKEALEFFEWGENPASSYTWWLGFLQALDGNNIKKTKHPSVKENSPAGLEQQEISYKLGETTNFVGASTDQISASLDEWLMFPTTEDDS